MSRPEQLEAKLDEDFVFYLSFATAAFQSVRGHDKSLCEVWLHKLCAEPVIGQAAKKVRNVYMFNLVMQMQEGSIKPPFTSPPPTGKLMPPSEVFPPDKPITKEPAWLQAISRGTGADLLHSSKDGRMYMTSRYLENGRGAMSYLAISIADKEPLFLKPSKIASGIEIKVSESEEESSSSSESTESSDSEDDVIVQQKKTAEQEHVKVPASAPCRQTLPQKIYSAAETAKVSAIVDHAPKPEMARQQSARDGRALTKFKLTKTVSFTSQSTTVSSDIRIGMDAVHPTPDPSATGEPPVHAKVDAAQPNVKCADKATKKPDRVDNAVLQKDEPKNIPVGKILVPEKAVPPPKKDLPPPQQEVNISEPAISVKIQPVRRSSPARKTSQVKVAVAIKPSSEQCAKEESSESSDTEDSEDETLCEIPSSMLELFAKRGTVTERWEILRVYDDLIEHVTMVLSGEEKPNPTLMVLLRKQASRHSCLVNAMPVKSRLLWLLTLLKETLISQRTQFVMRMTKLDCIQSAVQAGCKKKRSAAMWKMQFNAEDVDPVWRAEVCHMAPQNMKHLKKLYHPAVVNRFLHYLVQEKLSILARHKGKLNKKEQLMKYELRQEVKSGFEMYNQVRRACEEVMRVTTYIRNAANGAEVGGESQKDKFSQRKMEGKYGAMARDIQEQLNKSNATLRYETLRSRELCNMIEAEKKRMEQMESTYRESMKRKELHKKALEDELVWLSREIDAHSQKIVDLNTYL